MVSSPNLVAYQIMNLAEILSERKYGVVWIKTHSLGEFWRENLGKEIKLVGLKGRPTDLTVIDYDIAIEVVAGFLQYEMAFSAQMIERPVALKRAEFILSVFSAGDTTYYSNVFKNIRGEYSYGGNCTPMTDATFDTGLVIRTPLSVTAVWVEDED